jgi:hypothetical protein
MMSQHYANILCHFISWNTFHSLIDTECFYDSFNPGGTFDNTRLAWYPHSSFLCQHEDWASMPLKPWTRIQNSCSQVKWHTYLLHLLKGQWNEILFWETKINKTIATNLLFSFEPEFVIWRRSSISTHLLGPSVSVKWHSDCPWWNITLFLSHS